MMQRRAQSGFSLMELALVLALVAVMMSFGLEGINGFDTVKRIETTEERLEYIQTAIDKYVDDNSAYPCPARLDRRFNNVTGDGDPEFGEASCDTSFVTGIASDTVLVGALPVKALNLPERYASDGWGNKLVYIVSEDVTTGGTGSSGNGVIDIRYGTPGGNLSLTTAGAYMVISHGPEATGATGIKSASANSCSLDSTPNSYNCNFSTNVFYDTTHDYEVGNTTSFFDDYVVWKAADNGL